MKDNNDHIIVRKDQTLESWISQLMNVKKLGMYEIQYRSQKTHWYKVEDEHRWDFYGNEYKIVMARRYIIRIDKDDTLEIIRTNYTSDINDMFGLQSDGSTFIVMEEVQY